MDEARFLKCSCQKCGGHIEFPVAAAGSTVNCPHCDAETILFLDGSLVAVTQVAHRGVSASARTKSKARLWITLGLIIVITAAVITAMLWPGTPKPLPIPDISKPQPAPGNEVKPAVTSQNV